MWKRGQRRQILTRILAAQTEGATAAQTPGREPAIPIVDFISHIVFTEIFGRGGLARNRD
jgi:hypothetical protein